jgi:hypothetical protein
MHYKDGSEAKVGDTIRFYGYAIDHRTGKGILDAEFVGRLMWTGVDPEGTCNGKAGVVTVDSDDLTLIIYPFVTLKECEYIR